jgi:hypothetical protein
LWERVNIYLPLLIECHQGQQLLLVAIHRLLPKYAL